jgi:hypothetical protein
MLAAARILGDGSDGNYDSENWPSSNGYSHRRGHWGHRLAAVGVPAAIIGGALTTLTFGVAFKLAKTERAWTPALFLGGITALAGLVKLAHCANNYGQADGIAVQAAAPGMTVVTTPDSAATAYNTPATPVAVVTTPIAPDDNYDDGSGDSSGDSSGDGSFGRVLAYWR